MSDLRTKRTRAAIKRAFIELRAKKPLEKITVKELAELAEINKATFYLHYQDIYDLSDQVENELLENAFCYIHVNEADLLDPRPFIRRLIDAEHHAPCREAMETVFSGSRAAVLPDKVEKVLKAHYYEEKPHFRDNLYVDVLLSYIIQGSYRAFVNHPNDDTVEILAIVMEISHNVAELYRAMAPKEPGVTEE